MSKSMLYMAKAAAVPALLLTPFVFVSHTADAQDSAAQGAGPLEEVVVTARRREESLKDVPVAVSAFTGDYLDGIGAIDITALTQTTPNTTLEVSRATNTTLTAYIRGVGQQDPLAGFEGGVGIYLDDVYLARPQGTVFDLYDVERIEVLRGPQGTLYGRNTIGGAIKYVTRRLSDRPEFEVRGAVGEYRQADLMLKGSIPLSDTFRIGGAVATFNRNGFGDNLFTGEQNADKETRGIRLSAEWTPTEDWFIRLFGDYTEDDSSARHGHRLLVSAGGDPVLDDVFDTRAGISTLPSSNAGLDPQVDQQGIGLQVEWNLNDSWQLKSITSSRSDDSESLIDFDNLPANTFDAPVIYENEQFSQEFQASFTGDRSTGIFGAYYLDANAFNAFDVVIFNVQTAFTLGDYDTNAWAVYGDFTYDLSDTLTLSLGGRYTEDERDATVIRQTYLGLGSPYFGNDDAIPFPAVVPPFNGNRTDSDFTPRASLSWAPTDEHTFYASYNEGFKGGGFDPRGDYSVAEVRAGFEPEEVQAFEVGAKSVWPGGRIQSNFAFFVSDYKNVQVPGSIILDNNNDGEPDGFAGTTTNAGEADIMGAEFEMIGQFTDRFSSVLALGWIDADYTEWLVGGTDGGGNPIFVDISDEREFQNTPEITASVNLRYEFPFVLLNQPGELALSTNVSYRDDTFQFEVPDPLVDQKAYTLVDASVAWNSESQRFSMALHGRNLSDRRYIVANYNFPTVDSSVIGFYGAPRTWTLTGTVRFF
ncbi:MAG: TonB-dependent receptor [Pseudomonadota bacterium]